MFDRTDNCNVGKCLFDLLSMCHPDQKSLYCHELSKEERRTMSMAGFPHVRFSPKKPVGKNPIGKYPQTLALNAGVVDWRAKTAHALREYCITRLANDPNVNAVQVANHVRHKNVSSQNAYMRTSDKTQAAVMRSLSTSAVSAVERAEAPAVSQKRTQDLVLAEAQARQAAALQQQLALQQRAALQQQLLLGGNAGLGFTQTGLANPYAALGMQYAMPQPLGILPNQFAHAPNGFGMGSALQNAMANMPLQQQQLPSANTLDLLALLQQQRGNAPAP